MNTKFEKNKLYDYLGKDLVETFKKYNPIIAGGTITSLFSSRDINDIDVYFRTEESLIDFLLDIWDNRCWIVSNTNKATQFMYGKGGHDNPVNVQLIHFQYFNKPEDIFNTFDYTACMGAYDFSGEEFILHPDFLKHNSQRILKFNSDTAFPIVSLLRVQKYEKKGFYISKPEFIRIALSCMDLDINSYDELKEHLGGMYGVNYDKLFEDVDDKEFDLKDAIDIIADISLSDDYFVKPEPVEFGDIEDIIETISKKPVKIMRIKEQLYKINYEGLLSEIDDKPKNYIELNAGNYFDDKRFYKFVRKVGSKYISHYDDKFEYIVGETAVANTRKSHGYMNGHAGRLHMSEKRNLDSGHMHKRDSVMIELKVGVDNFVGADGHILATKAFVVREVSEEEWKSWDKAGERETDEDQSLLSIFK